MRLARARRARRASRAGRWGALVGCGLLATGAATLPAGAANGPPPLATVVVAHPGPGYALTSAGVLDRSGFAASTPDPAATERALAALATPATRAGTIATYERVWRDAGGHNEVRDVLVRFPSAVRAQAFVQAVHHSLESGEIVDSGPLRSIPGAHRVTYFASGAQARAGPTGVGTGVGVGQAITMRSGVLVALLSFLSAASADAPPISPADAARVAQAQYTAMASAPGGRPTAAPSPRGTSLGAMALAVVAVAVLALAVATPLLLRRRHPSGDRPGPTAVPGDVHPAP